MSSNANVTEVGNLREVSKLEKLAELLRKRGYLRRNEKIERIYYGQNPMVIITDKRWFSVPVSGAPRADIIRSRKKALKYMRGDA